MEASEATAAIGAEQPAEGDGGAVQNGSGPFDLSHVSEELRPAVAEALKPVEGKITQRFQDAADFRKRFEPFEGIEGLSDVPPEELKQLVGLREVLNDDDKFLDWFGAVGLEVGKIDSEAFEEVWEKIGEELGFFGDEDEEQDGEPGENGGGSSEEVEGLRAELAALKNEFAPVKEQLTNSQQAERQKAAESEIQGQLDKLAEKHGDFDQNVVAQLALAYEGADDAIERGFQDYLRITGQAESKLVEEKGDQPAPATSGGSPDTSVEAPTDFDSATRAARARMQAG